MDDFIDKSKVDFNEMSIGEIRLPGEVTIKSVEEPFGTVSTPSSVQVEVAESRSVQDRLQEVFDRDEQYRGKLDQNRLEDALRDPAAKTKLLHEMRLSDRVNRLEVQKMIDTGELRTAADFNTAAIIFQHGENTVDCRKAFELSLKAIQAGQPASASLVPAAFDRYLIYEQLDRGVPLDQVTQRFNTQTLPDAQGGRFRPGVDGKATKDELQLFGLLSSQDQGSENLDKASVLTSLQNKI